MESIEVEYINWIKNLINLNEYPNMDNIINYLYEMEYVVIRPSDDNRRIDGQDLRYKFLQEAGYNANDAFHIVGNILNKPCNVLEFIVAIAYRIDQDIMYDWSEGTQIYKWFWIMLGNLGLHYTYSKEQVYIIVTEFMHYNYQPNGAGGLFLTDDPSIIMTDHDIWTQMHIYLNQMVVL